MLTLALGLYKCNSMGLLPMGTGDWLAFETRGPVCEPALEYYVTVADILWGLLLPVTGDIFVLTSCYRTCPFSPELYMMISFDNDNRASLATSP
jgi:hypothetical protein